MCVYKWICKEDAWKSLSALPDEFQRPHAMDKMQEVEEVKCETNGPLFNSPCPGDAGWFPSAALPLNLPFWSSSLSTGITAYLSCTYCWLVLPLLSVSEIVSYKCEIRGQRRIKTLHLSFCNCLIPISRGEVRLRWSCLLYYEPC